MEGPTYKGREGRKKGRGRSPRLLRFPPGPRGARIVTGYHPSETVLYLHQNFLTLDNAVTTDCNNSAVGLQYSKRVLTKAVEAGF